MQLTAEIESNEHFKTRQQLRTAFGSALSTYPREAASERAAHDAINLATLVGYLYSEPVLYLQDLAPRQMGRA